MAEAAARGLGLSGYVIGRVAEAMDAIHRGAIDRALVVVDDFASRMEQPISQVAAWARLILEHLDTPLLLLIPPMPGSHQQAIHRQYAAIFRQRLDGALRDVEIGSVGGRLKMSTPETRQAKAMRLLQLIYDSTKDSNRPVIVTDKTYSAGLDGGEAEAAWSYLKDKGLIKTYTMPYAATINAAGIDAIEQAVHLPNQPTAAFPNITFNNVQIGNAYNSPVQQAGYNSNQTQHLVLDADSRENLRRLVDAMTAHLDELRLGVAEKQKTLAQLKTIDAQLSDEPNPIIIKEAGKTIRNITEGAIAGLVASAAQPSIWHWVTANMPGLFP